MAGTVGIDLGGTFIKTGLVREERVSSRNSRPTENALGADRVVENIIRTVRELLEESGGGADGVEGIGVAVPAQISHDRRVPVSPPNLRCLKGIPVAERVGEAFQLPATIENDANAAALGEMYYGAGRGSGDLVVLTLGTGVGGGVITGGQLLRGPTNAAGELGHILVDPNGRVCGCGRRGCLEGQISISALVEKGKSLCPNLELDAENGPKKLAEAARLGDSSAQQVFDQLGYYLGQGVADLVSIFGPDMVILGGGVSGAFDLFQRPLWESLRENCRFEGLLGRLRVETSQLGGDAAILGAAAAFQEDMRERGGTHGRA